MNGQLALLAPHPAARRTDPDTSKIAAERVKPSAAASRERALEILREHPGGLTDFELAEIAGGIQTSLGKRRGELRDLGLVRDSGRKRPSPNGSPAIVWQVVA